ncbi:hypothetical protein WS70_00920 [Burkholderia mayonis]|uniref:Uncharacterized protein n=1 Tax=Burkholderia mayonis TaxID=1385591 RepID=A0A1B4FA47_9BURK|nr:hypothetical protein WS70_00920 [Burkholderia mayonis]KVE34877.1 hypothetical protein WS69_15865 [Burkholderia sp. BDU5]KVE45300.1 hypothetical protein WS70_05265 [Burkholderia mayonis]
MRGERTRAPQRIGARRVAADARSGARPIGVGASRRDRIRPALPARGLDTVRPCAASRCAHAPACRCTAGPAGRCARIPTIRASHSILHLTFGVASRLVSATRRRSACALVARAFTDAAAGDESGTRKRADRFAHAECDDPGRPIGTGPSTRRF